MSAADRKKRNRLLAVVAAALLVAAVLAFNAFRKTEADYYVLKPIDLNYTILANCTVDFPKPLDMTFLGEGVVRSVEVNDGEHVARGRTLVQLDDFAAKRNLAISADSLKSAELKLMNARDEVLPTLREKLKESEVNLDQARLTLARSRQIEAAGGISKVDLEKADKEYQRVLTRYNQQQLEFENYSRSGRLADLEYEVSIAKSRFELAGRDMEDTRLAAPFDGTVIQVHVQPGEKATRATKAVTVIENAVWQLVLNVDQKELPFLRKGLAALITMDAYPEAKIEGEVSYVCTEVDKEKNTCELRVEIPKDVPFIKSGMAGKAEILAGKFEKALALPSRFVKRDSGGAFVWSWDGRKAAPVKVVFKPVGERWVITEGLAEGSVVLDADVRAGAARLRPGVEITAATIR
jgi:RND family efflux transporter MFP subunit